MPSIAAYCRGLPKGRHRDRDDKFTIKIHSVLHVAKVVMSASVTLEPVADVEAPDHMH